jgi:hypothetical protein
MISILISIIACVFIIAAGAVLYRYNQFSNDYYDVVDEAKELLTKFNAYRETLEIIEQHDVIGYDPLVSELVVKTKELSLQIQKSESTLQNLWREEE